MKSVTLKIISSLLFLIVIIPLGLSADIERSITQFEQTNLQFYCQESDGTDCSPTAQCYLTINKPDGDLLLNGVNMTNQGTYHNYSVYFNDLGDYTGKMVCEDSPASGVASIKLTVTPTGQKDQVGYYFLIIILSYGVVVLGAYKRDITITILGTFALYLVGLWVLFYGIDIYKNWLTNGFAIITLGIAGYLSTVIAQEYL